MQSYQQTGNIVAEGLGLSNPPTLAVRSRLSEVEISKVSYGSDKIGMAPAFPVTNVFFLGVYLTEVPYNEIQRRGRPVIGQGYALNSMHIADLSEEWSGNIFSTFEAVTFALPRPIFDEVAEEAGLRRVGSVGCDPGAIDPVVAQLVASILPAFERPNEANALFLEYVVLALCVHVLERYGIGTKIELCRGGLSPLQLKRATDLIASNLTANLSLTYIAGELGLSRQYFIKAFKQTTGLPPHRWLQQHRIRIVKELLRETSLAVVDIANKCGFADQSHLTRVFSAFTQDTPAAWRRKYRN